MSQTTTNHKSKEKKFPNKQNLVMQSSKHTKYQHNKPSQSPTKNQLSQHTTIQNDENSPQSNRILHHHNSHQTIFTKLFSHFKKSIFTQHNRKPNETTSSQTVSLNTYKNTPKVTYFHQRLTHDQTR